MFKSNHPKICMTNLMSSYTLPIIINLVVYMENALPQGLPRYGTAPGGSDHGHMVRAYQLPTRATGIGLQPLQRRDHCPFALLAEMAELTYGDARREWPEVELPTPTLVVSYSPATLSSV